MTRRKISFGLLLALVAVAAGVFALRPHEACVEADRAQHCEGLPEIDSELDQLNQQAGSVEAAPAHKVPTGVYGRAARATAHMAQAKRAAENSQPWKPYGSGPLRNSDPDYPGV